MTEIQTNNQESFEKLLQGSFDRVDNFSVGDRVKGKIVFISSDTLFVDINGKSEAVIPSEELKDDKGILSVKKGDEIEAYVVSTSGGEITLTYGIGKGSSNPAILNTAYQNGIPVEGFVSEIQKGGFSVTVSGVKCFCPFSQIDIRHASNPEEYLKKKFQFKITQYGERGRNIILSRRVLLDEKKSLQEQKLKATLKVGDLVQGMISSIRDFGVFMDMGGVDALIPKSELSWSRKFESDKYKIGDNIKAVVISIDWDKSKISLSAKAALGDPWDSADFKTGDTIKGNVVNIISSGAFVELKPGIEGFIHVSKMSNVKKISKPQDVISIGDFVSAKIVSIDKGTKKISLELITDEKDPWSEWNSAEKIAVHTATVEEVKPNGISARLSSGMSGFIPKEELTGGSADMHKRFSAGSEIKVAVKDSDPAKKKLILSEKLALKVEERADFDKYMKDSGEAAGSSSLGALFKNKFDNIKKDLNSQG